MSLRQQQIHEPPSTTAGPFHKLQIFRAKNHRAQNSQVIRELAHGLPIKAQAALLGGPVHFDFMLPLPHNRGSDEITFMFVPDHLCIADTAKRAKRREQVNRFEDIGLTLGVISEQHVKPRAELAIEPPVITKIAQPKLAEVHAELCWKAGNFERFTILY